MKKYILFLCLISFNLLASEKAFVQNNAVLQNSSPHFISRFYIITNYSGSMRNYRPFIHDAIFDLVEQLEDFNKKFEIYLISTNSFATGQLFFISSLNENPKKQVQEYLENMLNHGSGFDLPARSFLKVAPRIPVTNSYSNLIIFSDEGDGSYLANAQELINQLIELNGGSKERVNFYGVIPDEKQHCKSQNSHFDESTYLDLINKITASKASNNIAMTMPICNINSYGRFISRILRN